MELLYCKLFLFVNRCFVGGWQLVKPSIYIELNTKIRYFSDWCFQDLEKEYDPFPGHTEKRRPNLIYCSVCVEFKVNAPSDRNKVSRRRVSIPATVLTSQSAWNFTADTVHTKSTNVTIARPT